MWRGGSGQPLGARAAGTVPLLPPRGPAAPAPCSGPCWGRQCTAHHCTCAGPPWPWLSSEAPLGPSLPWSSGWAAETLRAVGSRGLSLSLGRGRCLRLLLLSCRHAPGALPVRLSSSGSCFPEDGADWPGRLALGGLGSVRVLTRRHALNTTAKSHTAQVSSQSLGRF